MTQDTLDSSHFELHVSATSSEQTALDLLAEQLRADVLLNEACPLSKQKIKSMMTNGAVWLESDIGIHRLRRAKKVIAKDSIVHLYYDEVIQNTKPDGAILVADEKEYSIWNKPYGMYSQGSKWGDHCTIYRWAETHLEPQRPSFLVHRLDRAANGLMILAHSKKMAKIFSDLFKNRAIQKRYKATVTGRLNELELPYTIDSKIDNKPAVSRIISVEQPVEPPSKIALISIEIETGRKHQVRKHLSEAGFPIVGDRLYGNASDNEQINENLQLQSYYLKFKCPITEEIKEYSL